MTEERKIDWPAIEGEYLSGVSSVNSIAERHGISEGAIRKKAKALGWLRDPSKTKRQLVIAAMSGIPVLGTNGTNGSTSTSTSTNGSTNYAVRTSIEKAASEIVYDLRLGLAGYRKALVKAGVMAEAADSPKDLKTALEALKLIIEGIIRINRLDEPVEQDDGDRALSAEEAERELAKRGLLRYALEE
jgi:hypothetical protein